MPIRIAFLKALLLVATAVPFTHARAGDLGSSTFIIRFDSGLTSTTTEGVIYSRTGTSCLLEPVEGELGSFRGYCRLRYLELSGLAATGTDGGFSVNSLEVSQEDGTVVLQYYPGGPLPNEWVVIPPAPPTQFFQWFSVYSFFHLDEFGEGGYTALDWDYPAEPEVYARKTYSRQQTLENALLDESTTLELIPIVEPPRIDEIHIESTGLSANDPETGKQVNLWADLHVPFPFAVQRCTWTGNNFTQPGEGDPDDSCRWSYTPMKGPGPERETYGDKSLTLTVVYRFGSDESVIEQAKSKDYKVFFTKKGDDDSDTDPNWFDYWGEDGAVPTMDAADVDYKASLTAIAEADGSTVYMGPLAAEQDGAISVPADADCVGGNFPGGQGIDLAALSLSHERRHNQLDALGGTDTDGDGVPDSAENGTSPTDPDSCNLAGVIDSEYASYGDNEFNARLAELGVAGVAENDWGLPGRQATQQSAAATLVSARSGAASSLAQPQHTTESQQLLAAQGAGTGLTGVYSSQGVDTDVDGLFNQLQLDVGVDVVQPGRYSVTAWLADDLGVDSVWAVSEVDLPAGESTMQLIFDGTLVNRLGALDPVQVGYVELGKAVGKHSVLQDSANDVHSSTYVSADFDPPAAVLSGVVSETPQDPDVDGLYDSLDLTVALHVNDPGEYEISAQLIGDDMTLPASANGVFMIADSTEQLTLSFDGPSLFYFRADGPYQLDWLRLTEVEEDVELDFIDTAWTTAAFSHDEFRQSGIVIDEGSYLDMGGVLDGDGKFATLDISFNISSMVPGPYEIRASLEDDKGKTIARASQPLGLGGVEGAAEVAAAMLSFPGPDIAGSGVDGPYRLADVTVISDAGIVMDLNPQPYLTVAYAADDFTGGGPPPGGEVLLKDGFEGTAVSPP